MRFIFNNIYIFLFFISGPIYAENYLIKVSGIKIGELVWVLEIDDENYSNEIKLESRGVLSAIYKFEGEYFSKGMITKNGLKPKRYSHVWKTNKIKKTMNLGFEDNVLSTLNQTPHEKEKLRINIFRLKQAKDPLSSFLEILMGATSSFVIDGRRAYTMNSKFNKKENITIIDISDYSNLWADHKRSKFEKISFEKKEGALLPTKINIYFDGRVFKLEQS